MTKIEKFCEAVKEHEGWFPGSRSQRNNNPGVAELLAVFSKSPDTVFIKMSRLTSMKLKVFNSIVRTVMIFVVNNLLRGKKSSKAFFHHKTMFKNVSVSISSWMTFFKNVYIAAMRKLSTLIVVWSMSSHSNGTTRLRAVLRSTFSTRSYVENC